MGRGSGGGRLGDVAGRGAGPDRAVRRGPGRGGLFRVGWGRQGQHDSEVRRRAAAAGLAEPPLPATFWGAAAGWRWMGSRRSSHAGVNFAIEVDLKRS